MSITKKMSDASKLTDKALTKHEKLIEKEYKLAFKEIKKDVALFVANYGTDGKANPAESAKFGRNQKLIAQIDSEINTLTASQRTELYATLRNNAQFNYTNVGFTLETEAQQKLAYTLLNAETINNILQSPENGLPLSETLKGKNADFKLKVQRALTQGLIRGESINKIAKRIETPMIADLNRSIMIARTETTRVEGQTRQRGYDHAITRGLEVQKEWVATLDDRTRDRHADLDGTVIPVDEPFRINGDSAMYPGGFSDPSLNINCRCTTIPVLPQSVINERRTREGTIPYKTYREWADNRL